MTFYRTKKNEQDIGLKQHSFVYYNESYFVQLMDDMYSGMWYHKWCSDLDYA